MLRFLTAGESHGLSEVAILEGMPAGLLISHEDINRELKKRMHDFGRGGRAKIETDEVKILSGVRFGKTIGSPIALLVENRDQAKWEDKVTKPRPGHADLAGVLKYGFDDVRDVLERASARETVMRVAVGAVCKKFLNSEAREAMKQEIINARMQKDTLGGVVEIIAHNVPVGLGSYVHFDKRLDARVAQSLMSIPSIKAVEIGNAIAASQKSGKEVQDVITVEKNSIKRKTNNMGGIEGGISNGEDIVVRVYHKSLSTIYDPLPTVNIQTRKPDVATVERSDVCVVARAGVVSESMMAFVLAESFLEKFGGDSMTETKRNFNSYIKHLKIKHV
ncbi:MAG: chorismate synthase [Candidatus Levybacteria bacterium]|nr:chorismate synthase [Candidatus Levybacteria bacterium]